MSRVILTKNRKAILDIFEKHKKPLSAEMIYELLNSSIDISTVYRSLDLFLVKDMIKRSYIDKTSYYYLNKNIHKHYMICNQCRELTEVDCRVSDILKGVIDETGFSAISHDLTVYGICSKCNFLNKQNY